MKHTLAFPMAVFAAIGLILGGCSDNPVEVSDGLNDDEAAIKYMASNDEFVRNDEETFSDRAVEPMDVGTFSKVAADITPLRFGRFVSNVSVTITVTIQAGDSIAIAHVEKTITGEFRIRAVDGSGDTILVVKPFVDKAVRNLIFKRIGRNPRPVRNWVPVATSLVAGGTEPQPAGHEINLVMLKLYLPNGDSVTITDPTDFYLRYRWQNRHVHNIRGDVPELSATQQVRLQATVVSASSDTDLVALRYGVGTFQKRRLRMQLVSEVDNGNGTFTRVYETSRITPPLVHFHRGFFHFGVDAMTRATLFTDTEPYSVSWWGIPYRVF